MIVLLQTHAILAQLDILKHLLTFAPQVDYQFILAFESLISLQLVQQIAMPAVFQIHVTLVLQDMT